MLSEFTDIAFGYAHLLLCLIKTEGESLSNLNAFGKLNADPLGLEIDGYTEHIKKERKQYREFNEENIELLCKITFKFLNDHFKKQIFKGVPGSSMQLIKKLELINLMVGIIQYAYHGSIEVVDINSF
jgi:hypothetical protein